MGGGGFTMQERSPALDRLVLGLTGKPVPRICFLPTASGDPREQTTRFHERFAAWPCEPTILSLFHLARDRIDPREHLLAQDAIYVGGGSMRNMLAIWREHGVDEAMRAAWEAGVVLAGLSAGAMCWFQGGVTRAGAPRPRSRGWACSAGSLSVHMDSEPERMPVFREAVAAGRLPAGYAADDGAALVFAGTRLQSAWPRARALAVVRVRPDDDGSVCRQPMATRVLSDPGESRPVQPEPYGVSELRALRAGRHRWD